MAVWWFRATCFHGLKYLCVNREVLKQNYIMRTEMKASNECLYPTDVFLVSCGMGCKRITVSDIAYIEAMKDNCVIHMIDGKCYTQSCPMGDIEPELNPNMFKRITVLSSSTLATSICTIMGMLFWRMVWKYTLVTSTVMP